MKVKLIIKIYLLFSVTMIVGFLFFSVTVSRNFASSTVELQRQYEKEIIRKRGSEINERLTHIGSVFSNAYLPDEQRNSIVSEFTENTMTMDESLIPEFLASVIRGNIYINDIFIIDLQSDAVWARSKRFIKQFDLNYDWKNDPFIQEVSQKAGIQMRGLHLSYGSNVNEEVYSFAHSIQNQDIIESGLKHAVILVNVKPEDLFSTVSVDQLNFDENFLVINEQHETVYQEFADKTILREEYENNPSYDISQMELLSWSGLTCLNIIDTNAIYEDSLQTILSSTIPIMAIILLFCLVITAITIRFFSKRINRIVAHISLLETGNFNETIHVEADDEFSIIEDGLNKMSNRLQTHIEKEYISTLQIAQARLQALQIQINPHFMFNTLETIRSTASLESASKTSRMITILGQMYRWNLRSKDTVTIKEELDYIEQYITLFEINKGVDIELSIQLSQEYLSIEVPKLSLQPIIENSLIHGYDNSSKNFSLLIEASEISDTVISLNIQDDGKGMSDEAIASLEEKLNKRSSGEDSFHIGLSNVHNRIKLAFGPDFGIGVLKDSESRGACVQLILPKNGEKNENV